MRAGFEAFTETGYDNTTVSDIVRRAGMTPSTFYNYFRDKDALLSDIVEEVVVAVKGTLADTRADPPAFGEFIAEIARAVFTMLANDRDLALFIKRNLPLVRSLVDHPAIAKLNSEIRIDLQGFVDRGELDPIDLDYAAGALRSSLLEVAILMLSRTPPDPEGAVEFTAQLVAGALSGKGGVSG